ncbi:MAG: CAP domain-containing protein [Bacillota bacterium]
MKDLLRIMIFLAIVLIGLFYLDPSISENELLEAPRPAEPLPSNNLTETVLDVERPTSGLSFYIGKSAEEWLGEHGQPDRIEPSAFSYEWWVYDAAYSNFVMAGVKEGRIVQVYAAGESTDVAPYEIGQKLQDLYRFTIVQNEVTVKYGTNTYTFNLSEADMDKRLLVSFEEVYAQLYIDAAGQELEAVRFMDAETLIRHQPYDMMYSGDLLVTPKPSSTLQRSIDEANARQLIDLTNVYRLRHQRSQIHENPGASALAKQTSEEMARRDFSSDEMAIEDLEARLQRADIQFKLAAINTASRYYDGAETVHGWFNSPSHRETLLGNQYNQLGVGVFGKYYSQILLKQDRSVYESQ